MSEKTPTENDKAVLRALCRHPLHNDRELSEDIDIHQSTVGVSKRRMRERDGLFKRCIVPSYHRVGRPLFSLSRAGMKRVTEDDMRHVRGERDGGSLISLTVRGRVDALVMAHHPDYTAFQRYVRLFDDDWCHEVHSLEGALKVSNLDFTNVVNRRYFPGALEEHEPEVQRVDRYSFSRYSEPTFIRAVQHPELGYMGLAEKTGVTRQSTVRIARRLMDDGVMERRTVVDLDGIGMKVMSLLSFRSDVPAVELVPDVERTLGPFFHWVFDRGRHIVMSAHEGHSALKDDLAGLLELDVDRVRASTFSTGSMSMGYEFEVG